MLTATEVLYQRLMVRDVCSTTKPPEVDVLEDLELVRAKSGRRRTREEVFLVRVRCALIKALVDAFIVAGIVFFSGISALGLAEFLNVVHVVGFSAAASGGLAFFTEFRNLLLKGGQ